LLGVACMTAPGVHAAATAVEPAHAEATPLGASLIIAAATAFIAAVGWTLAYFLTGLREERTKRLQLTIEHTASQIKEFYAPLMILTDQLDITVRAKNTVVQGKSIKEEHVLSGDFYKKFFLPIHEEINAILKSKAHLMEGPITPESFLLYFEHYITERAYWTMLESGHDVSNMRVPSFPSNFYYDVKDGREAVIARYDQSLRELRHLPWLERILGLGGISSRNQMNKGGAQEE
jgi:hypothetical protein